MLEEKSLDIAELTMRTLIVVIPINDAVQMSSTYLGNLHTLLLPPVSGAESEHLIHLLKNELQLLILRMSNIEGCKVRHHDGGSMIILKNDFLKAIYATTDGDFAGLIKGLYNTSRSLLYNLEQILVGYDTIDPEVVTNNFDTLYCDYCKQNAYVIDDILDEVKDPSAAIADLNKEFGQEPIVKMWKRYKTDTPALIIELRHKKMRLCSLDLLFDYRIRYEQLVKMNRDFDISAKYVNIRTEQVGCITAANMSVTDEDRTDAITQPVKKSHSVGKSDEILAVDSRLQNKIIELLDYYLAGKEDRAAAVVLQAFVKGALIIMPTFGQFKKRYGVDILDKTLYYRYIGASKTAIMKEEYEPILNQLKQKLAG